MNRYGVFGKQKKMAGIDAEKRIFGGVGGGDIYVRFLKRFFDNLLQSKIGYAII